MRSIVKLLLKNGHKVFIWQIGNKEIRNEFKELDVKICSNDKKDDDHIFQKWLEDNKIKTCFFNTYNIYENDGNKVELTKDLKIKTIGYVPFESIEDNEEKYDVLLSPSQNYKKNLFKKEIYNQIFLPYTLDMNEYDVEPKEKEDETIVYLHLKGIDPLAISDTEFLEENWNDIRKEGEELLIVDKKTYLMNRYDLIKYMKSVDCLILPFTKRNEICASIIESFGCEKPVITNNVEPMTDFVKDRINGFLVKETKKKEKIKEYRKIMDLIKRNMIRVVLSRNALKTGKELDSENFKETIEKLLK